MVGIWAVSAPKLDHGLARGKEPELVAAVFSVVFFLPCFFFGAGLDTKPPTAVFTFPFGWCLMSGTPHWRILTNAPR